MFCHGTNRCCGKDDPAGIRRGTRAVCREGHAEMALHALSCEGNNTEFLQGE